MNWELTPGNLYRILPRYHGLPYHPWSIGQNNIGININMIKTQVTFNVTNCVVSMFSKFLKKLETCFISENVLISVNQVSYYLNAHACFCLSIWTTYHSLQLVTFERRYGTVNMIRSQINIFLTLLVHWIEKQWHDGVKRVMIGFQHNNMTGFAHLDSPTISELLFAGLRASQIDPRYHFKAWHHHPHPSAAKQVTTNIPMLGWHLSFPTTVKSKQNLWNTVKRMDYGRQFPNFGGEELRALKMLNFVKFGLRQTPIFRGAYCCNDNEANAMKEI